MPRAASPRVHLSASFRTELGASSWLCSLTVSSRSVVQTLWLLYEVVLCTIFGTYEETLTEAKIDYI